MRGGESDAMTRQEAGSLHRGTPEGETGESPSPLKAFYFSRCVLKTQSNVRPGGFEYTRKSGEGVLAHWKGRLSGSSKSNK